MSVAAFISQLPVDRRIEFERVREVVVRNLPDGYEEVVSKNMLVYQVPLERFSATYNGQPLWYVALASEKSKLSLHLMPIYGSAVLAERLKEAFRALGKRPDMGKACIRFKRADDLPLDAIGDIVAGISVDRWIEIAKSARPQS